MNRSIKKPTESWVINTLKERFGPLAESRKVESISISTSMADLDDCCVLDFNSKPKIVIGSDYIRGRDFRLFQSGHLNYFDIGFYLVVANLSDLAAMGAWPIGITLILRYPEDVSKKQLNELIDGIASACELYGPCCLLGGDSGGATDLVLSATAIGITKNPLLRSSAQIGDKVYIIGHPGIAGAALSLNDDGFLINSDVSKNEIKTLLKSWRRPVPLIAEGKVLSKSGKRIACQDTSDGLKAALQQVAVASAVSIVVKEFLLKPHPVLSWAAQMLRNNVSDLYFGASVDFCLLITAAPDLKVEKMINTTSNCPVYCIGEVLGGTANVAIETNAGELIPLPGIDYLQ